MATTKKSNKVVTKKASASSARTRRTMPVASVSTIKPRPKSPTALLNSPKPSVDEVEVPSEVVEDTGLDDLDPGVTPARDAKHFRRIIEARQQLAHAESELRAAVKDAHAAGDSWTVIGMALDTSRQAAFQRFGKD